MISIEPSYAERLFEANLADATLFSRDPGSRRKRRDRVYMTAPGRART
jgi:hypothetical protein